MLLRQLFEQSNKKAVVAFGRMNPPTIGHLKLINKMKSIPGDHLLFLSHSQDPKQNPLSFQEKQMFASKFFPGVIVGNEHVKTPMHMMSFLEQRGYTDIIYIAGSDRVPEFDKLLNTYNGKLYNFNSIQVVNAGERDPDADGAEGMSASKMRAAVAADDFDLFRQGVPDQSMAQQMFDAVKSGMAAPAKKTIKKKPPTSLSESFNSTFMSIVENSDMSGTYTSKKPGLGFQSYATNHISPSTAKEDSSKKSDDKGGKDKEKERFSRLDPELERNIQYAQRHYAGYSDDPDIAYKKYIDRNISNNKVVDKSQDDSLKQVQGEINAIKQQMVDLANDHGADNHTDDIRQLKQQISDLKKYFKQEQEQEQEPNKRVDKNQETDINQLRAGFDEIKRQMADFEKDIKSLDISSIKKQLASLSKSTPSAVRTQQEPAIPDQTPKAPTVNRRDVRIPAVQRKAQGDNWKVSRTDLDQPVAEDWQKVNKKDKTDGMSSKAVKAYRRENPGSKLKTAVTTKPSKLKKGSKAAKRRSSFCARMSGMKKSRASAKTKRDPDSPINKALRRWNCEGSTNKQIPLSENIEHIMESLIEQILKNNKD